MSSKFDIQRSRTELTDEISTNSETLQQIYFVTEPFSPEKFSLERRPETALAIVQPLVKYEAPWLSKSVAQITVRSGVSNTTLFSLLLFAMLVLYCTFTISTVNAWEWLRAHSLGGVAALAMIYGAQSVIGILLSLIEEDEPVRLVSKFMQYTGALILLGGIFLIGGWLSTQWLGSKLLPLMGKPITTAICVLVLALVTQVVLNGFSRIYRALHIYTNVREEVPFSR